MIFDRQNFDSVLRGAYAIYTLEDGALCTRRFTDFQRDFIEARIPNCPHHHAGMRLDFYTDATALSMDFRYNRVTSRIFYSVDIYEDGVLTYSYTEQNAVDHKHGSFTHTFEKQGRKRVTVYLPYAIDLAFERIELSGESYIEPYTDYSGYIWMMGDSITHGYDAKYTSQTYASIVMRRLDLDGINQGAAGHVFDPELIDPALFEGRAQPDIITVAYGTNDWNTRTREDFCRKVDEFFSRLRECYPDIPLLVITPIFRGAHYTTSKVGSFCFAREYIAEAAKRYPDTYVLDGDKMVPHIYDYFRDVRVHPNDAGFASYGNLVADAVAEILGIRPRAYFI